MPILGAVTLIGLVGVGVDAGVLALLVQVDAGAVLLLELVPLHVGRH